MRESTSPMALASACAASASSTSLEAINLSSTKTAAPGSFSTARFTTSSHSDTEVIIHLYEEMGADCVEKLRGMFGLAIYDKVKRKLVLARDRLGKKPLHYALVKDKLYFGSEIKSILAVAPELAEVNAQGLLEYLYYGYVPDPITAFTGIQKLPPGHLLEFENGKIHTRQYWDLPEYNTHGPKSEEE